MIYNFVANDGAVRDYAIAFLALCDVLGHRAERQTALVHDLVDHLLRMGEGLSADELQRVMARIRELRRARPRPRRRRRS